MNDKKEKLCVQLQKFVPLGMEEMLADLLLLYPVKFKITKNRTTKLGDYRSPFGTETRHQISVNGSCNPYQFMVTALHEFAHLTTFLHFGRSVKPHGEEWKNEYRKLLYPAIQTGKFPKDIEVALMNSLVNTKASSCSDIGLVRVMQAYDEKPNFIQALEQLPKNVTFALNGRLFIKGELRRSRFICTDVRSKKNYLIHALADVEWKKEQD